MSDQFFHCVISPDFDVDFPMAKSLVRPRASDAMLGNDDVERLCLDCSREFYDNATNGNYNFGDMKQAYDWSV